MESLTGVPPMDLNRFHTAQGQHVGGHATALAELQKGRKTSHWIWYVFPQLSGLGRSSMATAYGLASLTEACEYLKDERLREHYLAALDAVMRHIRAGADLESVMGSRLDAQKTVSSITLFREAAERLDPVTFDWAQETQKRLLEAAFALENSGWAPCAFTLHSVERERA